MGEPSTIKAQKEGVVRPLDPQKDAYRLEIDEFIQDKYMLNLFLLALKELQDNSVLSPPTKDGKPPTEEELDKWWKSLDTEGMKKYWWSFFSIAGIHGKPQQSWRHGHPGVEKPIGSSFGLSPGYCQHGTPVFPTWHRPYVMMMEQSLFNKMHEIAKKFSDRWAKAEYVEAARRFRLPYWDPWMPRNLANTNTNWDGLFGVPAIFRAQEVFVRTPDNPSQLVQIDNPLYRYKLPQNNKLRKEARIPWEAINSTNDYPRAFDQTSIRSPGGADTTNSNDIVLDYELRSQAVHEQSKMLQMLINLAENEMPWDLFSNHKENFKHPNIAAVSLESWHDDFHVLLGSGRGASGHMIDPRIAAFDPIFWLHHCNIDRILALYQALHPNRYVSKDGKDKDGKDEIEKEHIDTPLYPFYKGKGEKDLWTSQEAKDWKQCGFAVPGTGDQDLGDLKKFVGEYINTAYLWIAGREPPPKKLGFPKDMDHVEALIGYSRRKAPKDIVIKAVGEKKSGLVKRTVPFAKSVEVARDIPATTASDITSFNDAAYPEGALVGNQQRTWNLHLTVRKFAFNGPFTINVFLGDVNDDASEGYLLLDNQVGFSGVFTSGIEAECENCNKQRVSDVRYADVIPLTTMLVGCLKSNKNASDLPDSLRKLESLEPGQVEPFLTERLEWRITTPDSTVRTTQEVIDAGLEIKVTDRWYTMPTPDRPLGWFDKESTLHTDVTRGKVGGYSG